ncbi:MAG TPA: amino acid ABC transporter substrate-binding protein, partial [Alphaproteobacteria bacterium]|nr:amino acid ABC transporter substrate-binding protein [Alphaproteobacteria bacterium]
VARVLLAAGAVAFIVYAGWTVVHSGAFDAQGYGAGFGLAMGGGGIGVWAKSGTEPEAKQAEND